MLKEVWKRVSTFVDEIFAWKHEKLDCSHMGIQKGKKENERKKGRKGKKRTLESHQRRKRGRCLCILDENGSFFYNKLDMDDEDMGEEKRMG